MVSGSTEQFGKFVELGNESTENPMKIDYPYSVLLMNLLPQFITLMVQKVHVCFYM